VWLWIEVPLLANHRFNSSVIHDFNHALFKIVEGLALLWVHKVILNLLIPVWFRWGCVQSQSYVRNWLGKLKPRTSDALRLFFLGDLGIGLASSCALRLTLVRLKKECHTWTNCVVFVDWGPLLGWQSHNKC
jgi:hypothetical protein